MPRLRLLPRRVELEEVRRLAPTDRRVLLGLAERTMAPVGLDLREGGHLLVFGDAGPARPRSCAPACGRSSARTRLTRRSWCSSTIGARCSARHPTTTCCTTSTSAPRADRRWPSWRRTSRVACPGPTSRRDSCATGPGGAEPTCSSWSTTTTWWPPRARRPCSPGSPPAAGPRHRAAPRPRPAGERSATGTVRSGAADGFATWPCPGCCCRAARRGPARGRRAAGPDATGTRSAGHAGTRRRGAADRLDRPGGADPQRRPAPNIPRAISRAAVRTKSLKAPDFTTS